ncbi:hypothetical protein AVEN_146828-1 [Araneus ventricosus]|uniref:Uncharacterized protein n=1 Tax=Araneus ventricosus TaxID=182803 RepID=A0A4Y2U255_ARAVE|nr:hypothetical protein AVEN_107579-1 [Araneus ventricosus]GBO06702.1 hypothetical protein AVEN_146828-1 [Araneus ventricosus]
MSPPLFQPLPDKPFFRCPRLIGRAEKANVIFAVIQQSINGVRLHGNRHHTVHNSVEEEQWAFMFLLVEHNFSPVFFFSVKREVLEEHKEPPSFSPTNKNQRGGSDVLAAALSDTARFASTPQIRKQETSFKFSNKWVKRQCEKFRFKPPNSNCHNQASENLQHLFRHPRRRLEFLACRRNAASDPIKHVPSANPHAL